MSELRFQDNIKRAVKEQGGYSIKLSNRFIAGIPDLLVILDGQVTFIECKKVVYKTDPKIEQKIPIKTTSLQKATMRAMAQAGARVAVAVMVDSPVRYVLLCPHQAQYGIWGVDEAVKIEKGKPWPIRRILGAIT